MVWITYPALNFVSRFSSIALIVATSLANFSLSRRTITTNGGLVRRFPIDNRNEASAIIIQGYAVSQLYRLAVYADESPVEFK